MPLSDRQKRELRSRSHAVACRLSLGKAGPSQGLLAEIRRALGRTDLVKVRIRDADRTARARIARAIARAIPCDLLGLTGFVATLHRSWPDAENRDITSP